ncbi:hypothetical protein CD29_12775 [Ureibacillus manganicus DSM 26584]|uniref:Uncharacterized protein n=1 Tax=Ureibacillus manganicus DSM 26584 TaxID=1384049 RepID=A0A0A3HZY0_9BACL|nr:hypothetical protein CD29_12775 [Ureibacillus manganicus DSM 26584]
MENDVLMFIMVILVQLIFASLMLGIFTSYFVNSRKKGFVFLTIYLLLTINSLYSGYQYSAIVGTSIVLINIGLGIVSYFVIRKRLTNVSDS